MSDEKEPRKKTQARIVWEFCSKKEKRGFTTDEVASSTGVDVQTVRHYLIYWMKKGTTEQIGKVKEAVGKRGRPRNVWKCKGKKFEPVWR